MNSYIKIVKFFVFLIFIGCNAEHRGHGHSHGTEDDSLSISVTQWTDNMEIFMEYPVMVKNNPAKFIIHLTFLDNFQPIRDGAVTLEFHHETGKTFSYNKKSLLREGIFTPIIELSLAGSYELTISFHDSRMDESFIIRDFYVFDSEQEIPIIAERERGEITFLKEQQWKIDFATELVQSKTVRQSIHTIAEVLPKQTYYTEITSPVDGMLRLEDNETMVIPGEEINQGQSLAVLAPTLGANNSWTDRKLAFEYAEKEYDRAKRLRQNNAISNREFEEIKHNYLIQKAGYDANSQSDDSNLFQLHAPIDGVVTELFVMPGQKVSSGQNLMTIVNLEKIWLRADLFENDYYKLNTPNGVSLFIPGKENGIHISDKDFHLLSYGSAIDLNQKTLPVLIEIVNPHKELKLGQIVEIDLYRDSGIEVLAVPETAIYEDETNDVVFIHIDGESFEKRIVNIGNKDQGWVAIHGGLKLGERVVTKGGYLVKLASTTVEIGHPHSH